MKLQEKIFSRPVKILQVFRNINMYGKDKKSFSDRGDDMVWQAMPSKSGHVLDNELFLPGAVFNDPQFQSGCLVTLEDNNQPQPKTTEKYNHCFQLTGTNRLDIFEVKYKEELELFLHYGYFTIGIPSRDNFKICELIKGKPVEIKINGKTDSSLTWRRARIFKDQFYIYEYLGEFKKCTILKEPFGDFIKQVPADRKLVDLMKPLW